MPRKRTSSPQLVPGAIAAIAGIALYVALYHTTTWNPYAVWASAWSIVTLAFYGYDKYQATHGGWRVPNLVLQALAPLGGYLGAWAGMLLFRHKSSQPDFLLILVISTIGHAILVGVWFVG